MVPHSLDECPTLDRAPSRQKSPQKMEDQKHPDNNNKLTNTHIAYSSGPPPPSSRVFALTRSSEEVSDKNK